MDFLHHRILVRLQQADVGIGVVADLVPLRLHPLEQLLVAGHLFADDKEGGRRPPFQQAVQQPPGGVRPGPVVKGQRRVFGRFHQVLPGFFVQPAQNLHGNLRLSAGILIGGQVRLHRLGAGPCRQQGRRRQQHA